MVGVIGDLVSVRLTIIALAVVMFVSASIFSYWVLKKDKKLYYWEDDDLAESRG